MALPSDMYRNPERWLILRGEDCTNCQHLGKWLVPVSRDQTTKVWQCDNRKAPQNKRERAPESRCSQWTPHKEDSGV